MPALLALLCLALLPSRLAPPDREADRSRFLQQKRAAAIEAGQRHLEYAVDLRREGLAVQAAAEIVLAVEVSKGQNPGATMVLRIMQDLGEGFWKKGAPRPTPSRIEGYARQSRKLLLQDQKERLENAAWAWNRQLWEDAHADYLELLEQLGQPLRFDAKGRITLDAGTIPEKESERLREGAIEINGLLYLRDRVLRFVPEIKSIFETRTPELCVRSTSSKEEADRIHALVLQLLPVLEADLGARPSRTLLLVLLGEVKHYDAYLDAAGMPENKAARGFSDKLGGVAIVCTGKLTAPEVPGLCLHEMTHQFQQSISRSTMPSWYDEGLAETYGGQGVFTWTDGKLAFGGKMPPERLAPLREGKHSWKLRDLLQARAVVLLAQDELRARAFYAQCWAFVRFLRTSAGEDVARRFAHWESACRGGLVEATIAGVGSASDKPVSAADLFLQAFGRDLPKLEDAFFAWLKAL